MFKVALVGTHGVNKTTIAYELAGALKRRSRTVELITEIARECPFPLNEQATRQAFQWIIARQIQLEIEKSPRADVLVCDRAVLDNFAYYVRRLRPDRRIARPRLVLSLVDEQLRSARAIAHLLPAHSRRVPVNRCKLSARDRSFVRRVVRILL